VADDKMEPATALATALGGEGLGLLERERDSCVSPATRHYCGQIAGALRQYASGCGMERPARETDAYAALAVRLAREMPAGLVGELRAQLRLMQNALAWLETTRAAGQ
jgi:hypothetical protein